VTAGVVRALGGGFLLAVLWMDLLFDVQVLGQPAVLPEPILASIAGYYRRVTTDAAPLHLLVAAMMVVTVAASAWALRAGNGRGQALAALLLVLAPVGLAMTRVFPNAARLGARGDAPEVQSALAHAICRDHLACLAAVIAFLVLQLAGAAVTRRSGVARAPE
jgi:hypothetical protein